MIIEMIMNTDMARHFQFLNNFRSLVESKRNEHGEFDVSQLRDEDRMLLLCAIVHCADLAGSTKPWPLCREWSKRLLLEFFNQARTHVSQLTDPVGRSRGRRGIGGWPPPQSEDH